MNYLTIDLPILKTISFNFLRLLWFCLVVSLVIIFCLTIIQMSFYAQEIFLIKNYESRIADLKEENKNLEVEFSKSNSLSNLQDYLKNFEKAKNIKYIKLTGATVVEK